MLGLRSQTEYISIGLNANAADRGDVPCMHRSRQPNRARRDPGKRSVCAGQVEKYLLARVDRSRGFSLLRQTESASVCKARPKQTFGLRQPTEKDLFARVDRARGLSLLRQTESASVCRARPRQTFGLRRPTEKYLLARVDRSRGFSLLRQTESASVCKARPIHTFGLRRPTEKDQNKRSVCASQLRNTCLRLCAR